MVHDKLFYSYDLQIISLPTLLRQKLCCAEMKNGMYVIRKKILSRNESERREKIIVDELPTKK